MIRISAGVGGVKECKTYKVISNSLLPQLWSVQPVMPCIWALDPCAGHQFRRQIPTTTLQQALFLQPRAPHAKQRDFTPEQLI